MSYLFFVLGSPAIAGNQTETMSGRELAQKIYDREVGEDIYSEAVMELVGENGSVRRRNFQVYGKDFGDQRHQLIRFTSPADIEGTGFLVLEHNDGDTEQFLFLPALRRSRRIVSDQKGHSFVNSDFTYEDMERRPVEGWTHRITGQEDVGKVSALVLESRPRSDTKTEYGLVRSWVAPTIYVPLKVQYFDKKERLKKVYKVISLQNVQGYWTETKVMMEDVDSGHKTVITNTKTIYDTGLDDDVFTKRNLENW